MFSDFFRNATKEEKERVIAEVVIKSTQDQLTIVNNEKE